MAETSFMAVEQESSLCSHEVCQPLAGAAGLIWTLHGPEKTNVSLLNKDIYCYTFKDEWQCHLFGTQSKSCWSDCV